ncbi:hypothetical protein BGZ47_007480 [Haplosporangium gracile]|nr:hypothetical protein BGZ47_007480 [Haplosporangium gracile]
MGRFGDLFGHRRIYIFGITWFSAWTIVNGFAKDPIIMSVGLALQGMGAGFKVPSALAILTTTYPAGPERTFALAVSGGTGAAGSVIGVLLGGILGSTIVLLFAFVFIEYKIDYPIMPLYIWKSRHLVAASLAIICVSAATNAMVYFSSLLFQNVLGYTPLNASLTYIVHGVGAVVANIVVNKLLTKVRTKLIMLVGSVLFVGSGVVFSQANEKSTYWEIPFPALVLNFMGMAPLGTPIGIAIANIVANSKSSLTAMGTELFPRYPASFYTVTVSAGVGLVFTVLVAANSNPVKVEKSSDLVESGSVATVAGDEEKQY